ncbi:MAG: hypothetical protein ACFFFT_19045 [Candidatus Thorarchaeota archaeon]
MSISIKPIVILIFVIGFISGFAIGIIFPFIGRSYFNLYFMDVRIYAGEFSERFGIWGNIISILSRNLILISILILGPYIIANSYIRDNKNPKKSLFLFTICSIFTYGFFPYGLFLRNLYTSLNEELFFKWILYFIPHGILETIVVLWAGSTAVYIEELFVIKRDHNIVMINYIFRRLFFASAYLLIATIIEAIISPISI